MRRRLVALLAMVVILSGCWSRVEVNDLAVISLVAVEVEEDETLRLFLHLVLPQKIGRPGGEGGGAEARAVHLVSSTGRTVLDAARRLQLQTPRRLFWAHANVVLVGERLATEGMELVEDFISRFADIRLRTQLYVVRGDLRQLLLAGTALERVPSDFIRELGREKAGLVVTVREYIRDRRTQGRDPILPWLDLVEAEEGEAEEAPGAFRLGGAALFRGSRLVAWLGQREMRTLMWLMGERTRGVVTAEVPQGAGYASVEIVEGAAERRVTWRGGRPGILINLSLETQLQDISGPVDITDERILAQVEAALKERMTSWIAVVLEETSERSVDPAGFGQLVRRSDAVAWKHLRERWREEIEDLPVSVAVRLNIRRTGLAKESRSTTKEEISE